MDRLFLEASTSGRVDAVLIQRRIISRLDRRYYRKRNITLCPRAILQEPMGFAGVVSPAEQGTVPMNGTTEHLQESVTTSVNGSQMIHRNQGGRQVTTFRWPAALIAEGQTVSVSGIVVACPSAIV